MYCRKFVYDEKSSDEYNVTICSFGGDGDGDVSIGSVVTASTVKAPRNNKFLITNSHYEEQLQFSFSICKKDKSENEYFTVEEQSAIARWLNTKQYKYLCFLEDGYDEVYYNCIIKIEAHKIGGQIAGYNLTVTCEAPWGYSQEYVSYIDNENNEINYDSDEIGYIYPGKVEINVFNRSIFGNTSYNIEILNETSGELTTISNCGIGEKIILTDMQKILSDQDHPYLLDDFNWKFVRICNDGNNEGRNIFSLTNCTMKVFWRNIRKVIP